MTNDYTKQCHDYIFNKLLKNWAEFGINHNNGSSVESLTQEWKKNSVSQIRLLTQCRQLYTFSHAYLLTQDNKWLDLLSPLYHFIIDNYAIKITEGSSNKEQVRWRFSLTDEFEPLDDTTDAYAIAFILLSFSYYYQASNDISALDYVKKTDAFLTNYMAAENGGFYEAYPVNLKTQRRQNPHMHLLEGYIAAFNTTNEASYKEKIIALLELMKTHFYESESQSLLEFFDANWQPDTKDGHKIEPGHHFEWVWLLHQAYKIHQDKEYLNIADTLWQTACKYGFDPKGGIYNQVNANSGEILDHEKRIWPMTEYLKAICVQVQDTQDQKLEIENTLAFMFENYFLKDGAWNEYLDKNNVPKKYPLPGTTSYHIFLGLVGIIDLSHLDSTAHS